MNKLRNEPSFPYWVCLIEEKCTGANYEKVQEFCRANGLTLSRHGHSVVWKKEWYQVFRFAKAAHAETFMNEFGGEWMHPSERGKGKRWSMWKKGTYKAKSKPEAHMSSARRHEWYDHNADRATS